ncbi:heparin lyase I family protein [Chroococcidiopsis sp. TS-821]|uniref:heparin lyase I family protein n=1 Tax=Chroococcidiopsis sp. TS-821 TaxID=1378066 RepID=UPI000CEF121B|nr:heparin lyase I family protein [Chroococcidiopsis sp. TS-821]PPS41154.1 hypothetical protein B1A85_17725 [Chroococcidiopsis sp. TS-821]
MMKFWAQLPISVAVVLILFTNKSQADIIDSVTQSIEQARRLEFSTASGGATCNQLVNASSIEGMKYAFKHWVNLCGERSELVMKKTEIGKTYWYGWSMFIPSNWQDTSVGYDIVNQWATYPTNKKFRQGCGGNGSYIARTNETFTFNLQYQGDVAQIVCNKFPLVSVTDAKGKWVDFVMHVKWTGNKDGFLRLWTRVGNEPYNLKINHVGSTYWNDEDTGPYFKMGLYKGDPNFEGPSPRYLYTAQYRLGDAKSTFRDVAPSR